MLRKIYTMINNRIVIVFCLILLGCKLNTSKSPVDRLNEKYDVICNTAYSKLKMSSSEGSYHIMINSKIDTPLIQYQIDDIVTTLRSIPGKPATDLYNLMSCYRTGVVKEMRAQEGHIIRVAIGKPSNAYNFLVVKDTIRIMTQLTTG